MDDYDRGERRETIDPEDQDFEKEYQSLLQVIVACGGGQLGGSLGMPERMLRISNLHNNLLMRVM